MTDFAEFAPDDVPEVQVETFEPDEVIDDFDSAESERGTSLFGGTIEFPGTAGIADGDNYAPLPEVEYSYGTPSVDAPLAFEAPRNSDRKLVEIPIENLVLDERLQPRSNMTQTMVDEYMEDIAEGDQFPPVEVVDSGRGLYLVDGWHRVAAYRALGHPTVFAYVSEGGMDYAVLASSGANASHGLRRTNADKRRSVMRLLTTASLASMSDAALARAAKVSTRFVGIIRQTLEEEGSIPEVTQRIGVDGKVHDTSAFQETIANAPRLEQPKDPIKDEPSEFDNPDDPKAYETTANDRPPRSAAPAKDDDDGDFLSLEESGALAAFDAVANLLKFMDNNPVLMRDMARAHRREQLVLVLDRFDAIDDWLGEFFNAD